MAYIIRVTPGGSLISGLQSFSCGQSFLASTGVLPAQADLDTWTEQLWLDFKAQFLNANVRGLMDGGTNWTQMRSYIYSNTPSGPALLASTSTSAGLAGTGAAPTQQATQVAVVVTTRTGTPGARGRGRAYVPCRQIDVGLSGRFSTTSATYLSTGWANWLALANTRSIGGTTVRACVWARSSSSAPPVTSVKVDNRPDVQRRRADKVGATAAAVTVVPVP